MFRLQFKILRKSHLLTHEVFQKYKSRPSCPRKRHFSSNHLKVPMSRKLSKLLNISNKQNHKWSTINCYNSTDLKHLTKNCGNVNNSKSVIHRISKFKNCKSKKSAALLKKLSKKGFIKKCGVRSGRILRECSCNNKVPKDSLLIKIELPKDENNATSSISNSAYLTKIRSYNTLCAKYSKLQHILSKISRNNHKMLYYSNKYKDDAGSKSRYRKRCASKSRINNKYYLCKDHHAEPSDKSKFHKASNHHPLRAAKINKSNVTCNHEKRNRKKIINIIIEFSGVDNEFSKCFGNSTKKTINILNEVNPQEEEMSENIDERSKKEDISLNPKEDNNFTLTSKQKMREQYAALDPTEIQTKDAGIVYSFAENDSKNQKIYANKEFSASSKNRDILPSENKMKPSPRYNPITDYILKKNTNLALSMNTSLDAETKKMKTNVKETGILNLSEEKTKVQSVLTKYTQGLDALEAQVKNTKEYVDDPEDMQKHRKHPDPDPEIDIKRFKFVPSLNKNQAEASHEASPNKVFNFFCNKTEDKLDSSKKPQEHMTKKYDHKKWLKFLQQKNKSCAKTKKDKNENSAKINPEIHWISFQTEVEKSGQSSMPPNCLNETDNQTDVTKAATSFSETKPYGLEIHDTENNISSMVDKSTCADCQEQKDNQTTQESAQKTYNENLYYESSGIKNMNQEEFATKQSEMISKSSAAYGFSYAEMETEYKKMNHKNTDANKTEDKLEIVPNAQNASSPCDLKSQPQKNESINPPISDNITSELKAESLGNNSKLESDNNQLSQQNNNALNQNWGSMQYNEAQNANVSEASPEKNVGTNLQNSSNQNQNANNWNMLQAQYNETQNANVSAEAKAQKNVGNSFNFNATSSKTESPNQNANNWNMLQTQYNETQNANVSAEAIAQKNIGTNLENNAASSLKTESTNQNTNNQIQSNTVSEATAQKNTSCFNPEANNWSSFEAKANEAQNTNAAQNTNVSEVNSSNFDALCYKAKSTNNWSNENTNIAEVNAQKVVANVQTATGFKTETNIQDTNNWSIIQSKPNLAQNTNVSQVNIAANALQPENQNITKGKSNIPYSPNATEKKEISRDLANSVNSAVVTKHKMYKMFDKNLNKVESSTAVSIETAIKNELQYFEMDDTKPEETSAQKNCDNAKTADSTNVKVIEPVSILQNQKVDSETKNLIQESKEAAEAPVLSQEKPDQIKNELNNSSIKQENEAFNKPEIISVENITPVPHEINSAENKTEEAQNSPENDYESASYKEYLEYKNEIIKHYLKNILSKKVKPEHRIFKVRPYVKNQYSYEEVTAQFVQNNQAAINVQNDVSSADNENKDVKIEEHIKHNISNIGPNEISDAVKKEFSSELKQAVLQFQEKKQANELQTENKLKCEKLEEKNNNMQEATTINNDQVKNKEMQSINNTSSSLEPNNNVIANTNNAQEYCNTNNTTGINEKPTCCATENQPEKTNNSGMNSENMNYSNNYQLDTKNTTEIQLQCSQNVSPANYENNNASTQNEKCPKNANVSTGDSKEQTKSNKHALLLALVKFNNMLSKEITKAIEVDSGSINITKELYSQLKMLRGILTKDPHQMHEVKIAPENQIEYETIKTDLLNALVKFNSIKTDKIPLLEVEKVSIKPPYQIGTETMVRKNRRSPKKIKYIVTKKFDKIIEKKYSSKVDRHKCRTNKNNSNSNNKLDTSKLKKSKTKTSAMKNKFDMKTFQSNQNIYYYRRRTNATNKQNYNNKNRLHTTPVLYSTGANNNDDNDAADQNIPKIHHKPEIYKVKAIIPQEEKHNPISLVNKAPEIYKVPETKNKFVKQAEVDKKNEILTNENDKAFSKRYNFFSFMKRNESYKLKDKGNTPSTSGIPIPYKKGVKSNFGPSSANSKGHKSKNRYPYGTINSLKPGPLVSQNNFNSSIGVKNILSSPIQISNRPNTTSYNNPDDPNNPKVVALPKSKIIPETNITNRKLQKDLFVPSDKDKMKTVKMNEEPTKTTSAEIAKVDDRYKNIIALNQELQNKNKVELFKTEKEETKKSAPEDSSNNENKYPANESYFIEEVRLTDELDTVKVIENENKPAEDSKENTEDKVEEAPYNILYSSSYGSNNNNNNDGKVEKSKSKPEPPKIFKIDNKKKDIKEKTVGVKTVLKDIKEKIKATTKNALVNKDKSILKSKITKATVPVSKNIKPDESKNLKPQPDESKSFKLQPDETKNLKPDESKKEAKKVDLDYKNKIAPEVAKATITKINLDDLFPEPYATSKYQFSKLLPPPSKKKSKDFTEEKKSTDVKMKTKDVAKPTSILPKKVETSQISKETIVATKKTETKKVQDIFSIGAKDAQNTTTTQNPFYFNDSYKTVKTQDKKPSDTIKWEQQAKQKQAQDIFSSQTKDQQNAATTQNPFYYNETYKITTNQAQNNYETIKTDYQTKQKEFSPPPTEAQKQNEMSTVKSAQDNTKMYYPQTKNYAYNMVNVPYSNKLKIEPVKQLGEANAPAVPYYGYSANTSQTTEYDKNKVETTKTEQDYANKYSADDSSMKSEYQSTNYSAPQDFSYPAQFYQPLPKDSTFRPVQEETASVATKVPQLDQSTESKFEANKFEQEEQALYDTKTMPFYPTENQSQTNDIQNQPKLEAAVDKPPFSVDANQFYPPIEDKSPNHLQTVHEEKSLNQNITERGEIYNYMNASTNANFNNPAYTETNQYDQTKVETNQYDQTKVNSVNNVEMGNIVNNNIEPKSGVYDPVDKFDRPTYLISRTQTQKERESAERKGFAQDYEELDEFDRPSYYYLTPNEDNVHTNNIDYNILKNQKEKIMKPLAGDKPYETTNAYKVNRNETSLTSYLEYLFENSGNMKPKLSNDPQPKPVQETPYKPVEEAAYKPVQEAAYKPVQEAAYTPVPETAYKPVQNTSFKPVQENTAYMPEKTATSSMESATYSHIKPNVVYPDPNMQKAYQKSQNQQSANMPFMTSYTKMHNQSKYEPYQPTFYNNPTVGNIPNKVDIKPNVNKQEPFTQLPPAPPPPKSEVQMEPALKGDESLDEFDKPSYNINNEIYRTKPNILRVETYQLQKDENGNYSLEMKYQYINPVDNTIVKVEDASSTQSKIPKQVQQNRPLNENKKNIDNNSVQPHDIHHKVSTRFATFSPTTQVNAYEEMEKNKAKDNLFDTESEPVYPKRKSIKLGRQTAEYNRDNQNVFSSAKTFLRNPFKTNKSEEKPNVDSLNKLRSETANSIINSHKKSENTNQEKTDNSPPPSNKKKFSGITTGEIKNPDKKAASSDSKAYYSRNLEMIKRENQKRANNFNSIIAANLVKSHFKPNWTKDESMRDIENKILSNDKYLSGSYTNNIDDMLRSSKFAMKDDVECQPPKPDKIKDYIFKNFTEEELRAKLAEIDKKPVSENVKIDTSQSMNKSSLKRKYPLVENETKSNENQKEKVMTVFRSVNSEFINKINMQAKNMNYQYPMVENEVNTMPVLHSGPAPHRSKYCLESRLWTHNEYGRSTNLTPSVQSAEAETYNFANKTEEEDNVNESVQKENNSIIMEIANRPKCITATADNSSMYKSTYHSGPSLYMNFKSSIPKWDPDTRQTSTKNNSEISILSKTTVNDNFEMENLLDKIEAMSAREILIDENLENQNLYLNQFENMPNNARLKMIAASPEIQKLQSELESQNDSEENKKNMNLKDDVECPKMRFSGNGPVNVEEYIQVIQDSEDIEPIQTQAKEKDENSQSELKAGEFKPVYRMEKVVDNIYRTEKTQDKDNTEHEKSVQRVENVEPIYRTEKVESAYEAEKVEPTYRAENIQPQYRTANDKSADIIKHIQDVYKTEDYVEPPFKPICRTEDNAPLIKEENTQHQHNVEIVEPIQRTENFQPVQSTDYFQAIQKIENFSPISRIDNFQPIQRTENFQLIPRTATFQPIQRTENFQPIQRIENFQPIPRTENFQPIQSTEHFQPIQRTENFQPIQKIENFQPIQKIENFQPISKTDSFEPIYSTGNLPPRAELNDPVYRTEVAAPLFKSENIQPYQRTESVQPINRAENIQPYQRTESVQPINRPENIQPYQRTESVQPINRAENIQPYQRTENVQPLNRSEIKTQYIQPIHMHERENILPVYQTPIVQPISTAKNMQPRYRKKDTAALFRAKNTPPRHRTNVTAPIYKSENIQPQHRAESVQPIYRTPTVQPINIAENNQPTCRTEDSALLFREGNTHLQYRTANVEPINMAENIQPIHITENIQPIPTTENIQPIYRTENIQPQLMAENRHSRDMAGNIQSIGAPENNLANAAAIPGDESIQINSEFISYSTDNEHFQGEPKKHTKTRLPSFEPRYFKQNNVLMRSLMQHAALIKNKQNMDYENFVSGSNNDSTAEETESIKTVPQQLENNDIFPPYIQTQNQEEEDQSNQGSATSENYSRYSAYDNSCQYGDILQLFHPKPTKTVVRRRKPRCEFVNEVRYGPRDYPYFLSGHLHTPMDNNKVPNNSKCYFSSVTNKQLEPAEVNKKNPHETEKNNILNTSVDKSVLLQKLLTNDQQSKETYNSKLLDCILSTYSEICSDHDVYTYETDELNDESNDLLGKLIISVVPKNKQSSKKSKVIYQTKKEPSKELKTSQISPEERFFACNKYLFERERLFATSPQEATNNAPNEETLASNESQLYQYLQEQGCMLENTEEQEICTKNVFEAKPDLSQNAKLNEQKRETFENKVMNSAYSSLHLEEIVAKTFEEAENATKSKSLKNGPSPISEKSVANSPAKTNDSENSEISEKAHQEKNTVCSATKTKEESKSNTWPPNKSHLKQSLVCSTVGTNEDKSENKNSAISLINEHLEKNFAKEEVSNKVSCSSNQLFSEISNANVNENKCYTMNSTAIKSNEETKSDAEIKSVTNEDFAKITTENTTLPLEYTQHKKSIINFLQCIDNYRGLNNVNNILTQNSKHAANIICSARKSLNIKNNILPKKILPNDEKNQTSEKQKTNVLLSTNPNPNKNTKLKPETIPKFEAIKIIIPSDKINSIVVKCSIDSVAEDKQKTENVSKHNSKTKVDENPFKQLINPTFDNSKNKQALENTVKIPSSHNAVKICSSATKNKLEITHPCVNQDAYKECSTKPQDANTCYIPQINTENYYIMSKELDNTKAETKSLNNVGIDAANKLLISKEEETPSKQKSDKNILLQKTKQENISKVFDKAKEELEIYHKLSEPNASAKNEISAKRIPKKDNISKVLNKAKQDLDTLNKLNEPSNKEKSKKKTSKEEKISKTVDRAKEQLDTLNKLNNLNSSSTQENDVKRALKSEQINKQLNVTSLLTQQQSDNVSLQESKPDNKSGAKQQLKTCEKINDSNLSGAIEEISNNNRENQQINIKELEAILTEDTAKRLHKHNSLTELLPSKVDQSNFMQNDLAKVFDRAKEELETINKVNFSDLNSAVGINMATISNANEQKNVKDLGAITMDDSARKHLNVKELNLLSKQEVTLSNNPKDIAGINNPKDIADNLLEKARHEVDLLNVQNMLSTPIRKQISLDNSMNYLALSSKEKKSVEKIKKPKDLNVDKNMRKLNNNENLTFMEPKVDIKETSKVTKDDISEQEKANALIKLFDTAIQAIESVSVNNIVDVRIKKVASKQNLGDESVFVAKDKNRNFEVTMSIDKTKDTLESVNKKIANVKPDKSSSKRKPKSADKSESKPIGFKPEESLEEIDKKIPLKKETPASFKNKEVQNEKNDFSGKSLVTVIKKITSKKETSSSNKPQGKKSDLSSKSLETIDKKAASKTKTPDSCNEPQDKKSLEVIDKMSTSKTKATESSTSNKLQDKKSSESIDKKVVSKKESSDIFKINTAQEKKSDSSVKSTQAISKAASKKDPPGSSKGNKQQNKKSENKKPQKDDTGVPKDDKTPLKDIKIQDNEIFRAAMEKFEKQILETVKRITSKHNKPISKPPPKSTPKIEKKEKDEKSKDTTAKTSNLNNSNKIRNQNQSITIADNNILEELKTSDNIAVHEDTQKFEKKLEESSCKCSSAENVISDPKSFRLMENYEKPNEIAMLKPPFFNDFTIQASKAEAKEFTLDFNDNGAVQEAQFVEESPNLTKAKNRKTGFEHLDKIEKRNKPKQIIVKNSFSDANLISKENGKCTNQKLRRKSNVNKIEAKNFLRKAITVEPTINENITFSNKNTNFSQLENLPASGESNTNYLDVEIGETKSPLESKTTHTKPMNKGKAKKVLKLKADFEILDKLLKSNVDPLPKKVDVLKKKSVEKLRKSKSKQHVSQEPKVKCSSKNDLFSPSNYRKCKQSSSSILNKKIHESPRNVRNFKFSASKCAPPETIYGSVKRIRPSSIKSRADVLRNSIVRAISRTDTIKPEKIIEMGGVVEEKMPDPTNHQSHPNETFEQSEVSNSNEIFTRILTDETFHKFPKQAEYEETEEEEPCATEELVQNPNAVCESDVVQNECVVDIPDEDKEFLEFRRSCSRYNWFIDLAPSTCIKNDNRMCVMITKNEQDDDEK